MALFTVHYGESSLKGKNRYIFENKLISNIKEVLKNKIKKIEKIEKRIIFKAQGKETEIKDALSRIPGIEWYAKIYETTKNKEEISKTVLKHLTKYDIKNKAIRVDTKRCDKNFLFTSMELNRLIGAEVVKKFKCKVNLSKPDITIYIEIMQKNRAFVYFEKIQSIGGLPVGTSGKVIALFSGGIDSSVASWMLMRRGSKIIFLHIHSFSNEKEIKKSKIINIVKELGKWQNKAKIYFADYIEFYKKTFLIPPGYELILFRKFIYLLAQKIAKKEKSLAIVSGDSLGQVASQTLENIYAINQGLEIPVFRPLIGINKNEIIHIAKKIKTYELSIQKYKDCCSLVAQNPETKAKLEKTKYIEEKINIDEIVLKTMEKIKIIEI